jgi:hypothetical protein
MLDYAANAVAYWPVETIRAKFEMRCSKEGDAPDQVLHEFLDESHDAQTFWYKVKTNLQAGNIRLIFVADEIPPELRRIVEFLNAQMDPAEVLALEVRQYEGQGQRTLVPRIIGQTAEAEQKKSASANRQWDETSFFNELERRNGAEARRTAQRILDWARSRSLRTEWGSGGRSGSLSLMLDHKGEAHSTVVVYTYGSVEVQFQYMKDRQPFRSESLREELRHKLNEINAADIPPDGVERRPSIALNALTNEGATEHLIKTFDWVIERVQESV